MCGIAGEFRFDGEPVRQEGLRKMVQALVHRGPDSKGFFFDQNFGMGMRRLKVIDLEKGEQPVFNEDGSLALVFNGEIYNFQELRDGLMQRDHFFKTRSDTEVIVHAFEDKRDRCLESLSGMFAFALWDKKGKELFLARDRFGIKPLYYVKLPHAFYFASEIRALLTHPDVPRETDLGSLDFYLTLGYVPTPRTLFRHIQKLPPAHFLQVSRDQFESRPYWRLVDQHQAPLKEEECLENLEHLAKASVKKHLISDVPLGIFLSGGTDSSTLVALASELSSRPVKTFSIGFPDEPSYNELPFAREVAQRFGTEHHEYEVTPHAIEILPKLVRHLEEPLADPSVIPTYFLCGMARREVTVALAGEGGDEIFAGYNRYFWDGWADHYQRIPSFFRKGILHPLARLLPEAERKGVSNVFRRIKKFINTADLERSARYASWFSLNPASSNGLAGELYQHYFKEAETSDPLREMQYADMHTLLLDDLLLKGDKISMAHSLELRVPFLDHRLVEFAYNLPASMKLRRGDKKYLLRRLLYRYLPKKQVNRPKRGFEVPIGKWFRGPMRPFIEELLLSSQVKRRGILNPAAIQSEILQPHLDGRQDNGLALFSLVMFENWCREFLDQPYVKC